MLKFSLKIRSGKYKISLLSDKIIDIIQIASPSLPTDRNDGNYRELIKPPTCLNSSNYRHYEGSEVIANFSRTVIINFKKLILPN